MSNYHIGLSGLQVAQRSIELIGVNIANASTKGYHRQELRTSPIQGDSVNGAAGGVEITDVHRTVDLLMEREIALQRPKSGQNSQELASLRLIENSLGDLDSQGLTLSLDQYFNSLRELSAQPNSQPLRYKAVWAASALTDQFRYLGTFLADLRKQVAFEADNLTNDANGLVTEIGWLNGRIRDQIGRGQSANALRDRRDQAVLELGDLVDITVEGQSDPSGMVNVQAWGTPLITGSMTTHIETGVTTDGLLGVSARNGGYLQTDARGGKIGGLLGVRNSILPGIIGKLDTLARSIISRTNKIHVQGTGESGSFTDLTGWAVSSSKLSDWSSWGSDLTAGVLNVRITDQVAGTTAIHQITVDGDSTVQSVATALNSLTGLTAEVAGSALHISSSDASRYKFDFLPESVTDLTTNPWTGSASPAVTGNYTGQGNEVFTFTVTGTGSAGDSADIGVTSGLAVEVRNASGELVKTVAVGLGYAAGDRLDVGNGLELAMPTGTLKLGEKFQVTAVAESDSSGFLAAAGMNAFFTGTNASTIAVRDAVLADPKNLATSIGSAGTDNINVRRMADLADSRLTELGDFTPGDYFHQVVTGVGQDIAFRQARQTSLEGAMAQLENERQNVSGVDINEEAAKLLVYEQLFQAVAKFMSVQSDVIDYLIRIV